MALDTPNKNRTIAIAVVASIVVLAIAIFFFNRSTSVSGSFATGQAFYSDDDGATWFTDSADKLTPFDHDGKQAVRAYIYQCGSGKKFVGRLERYTAEQKKFLQDTQTAISQGKPPPRPTAPSGPSVGWGSEVKKPGDSQWIPANDFTRAASILNPKCPDGHPATLINP